MQDVTKYETRLGWKTSKNYDNHIRKKNSFHAEESSIRMLWEVINSERIGRTVTRPEYNKDYATTAEAQLMANLSETNGKQDFNTS